jgi:hypothetical protein
MKNYFILSALAAMWVIASCEEQQVTLDQTTELQDQLAHPHPDDSKPPLDTLFLTHASGDQVVPPSATRAQGQGTFKFIRDRWELSYKLIVANIENVTEAHIHLAPVGEDGDVVVRLYPSRTRAQLIHRVFNGILAEGVITDADLPEDLALVDLIKEINDGNAYVNVRTSQYPAGEIRGQIWSNRRNQGQSRSIR